MLRFPVATLIRFCHNHGLLQVSGPAAVAHGARRLARVRAADRGAPRRRAPERRRCGACSRVAGGAAVTTDGGTEHFDEVVLACHSDQALALLADASHAERARARRHPLPAEPRRAAHRHVAAAARRRARGRPGTTKRARAARRRAAVCLHYLINRLQPLPWTTPVVVSLNPVREPLRRRCRAVRLRPPGVRPAPIAAQRACAGSRAAQHLVLRRLDGLRLP